MRPTHVVSTPSGARIEVTVMDEPDRYEAALGAAATAWQTLSWEDFSVKALDDLDDSVDIANIDAREWWA